MLLDPKKFKKAQILVGDIIADRIYDPPKKKPPLNPQKFFIYMDEGAFVCKWCGNCKGLRPFWRDRNIAYMEITNPHKGYDLDEWDALTTVFYVSFCGLNGKNFTEAGKLCDTSS